MIDKTKKIVVIASLGLALGLGLNTTGQVAQAQQEIQLLSLNYREILRNASMDERLNLLLDLYNSGKIDWEGYSLYRDLLLSSYQGKQLAYENLIDYYVKIGAMSFEQGVREKNYGYNYDLDYELLRTGATTYSDDLDLEVEYSIYS